MLFFFFLLLAIIGPSQAIKIVDKTTRRRLGRSQLSNEQKIRREIAIMKKCIHPNVVRLIEVIDDPNARKIYMGRTNMNVFSSMCSLVENGQGKLIILLSCATCIRAHNTSLGVYGRGRSALEGHPGPADFASPRRADHLS